MNETNAQVFRKGMKDAIPIGLGYLTGNRRKKCRHERISGILNEYAE